MSRLEGGTHFLGLSVDGEERRIFFVRQFQDALSRLDGHTRLSPIFALDNAPPPSLTEDDLRYLLFVGPIYPGAMPLGSARAAFLTLGLLNVVVYSASEEERQQARDMIAGRSLSWEEWTLAKNVIVRV